ncbi:unnamed protein product [Protopolystoma xenopodis]|uniref:Uncharacterized protein n=1 Tax=Protopolystoma xenopodis TaxID=117903 RepID=A0A448WP92_9PLAT|nr:unnamed protein product [Protopolystoma xenopodis]
MGLQSASCDIWRLKILPHCCRVGNRRKCLAGSNLCWKRPTDIRFQVASSSANINPPMPPPATAPPSVSGGL